MYITKQTLSLLLLTSGALFAAESTQKTGEKLQVIKLHDRKVQVSDLIGNVYWIPVAPEGSTAHELIEECAKASKISGSHVVSIIQSINGKPSHLGFDENKNDQRSTQKYTYEYLSQVKLYATRSYHQG